MGFSTSCSASQCRQRLSKKSHTFVVENTRNHSDRGWAAVTWKCHLALQAWTPGVTWSVTWCYLVLPGVLPGVTWALPGVTWVLFWSLFFLWSQNIRVPQTQTFGQKINFHLEMLPGPTPVVVTCLPAEGWQDLLAWGQAQP